MKCYTINSQSEIPRPEKVTNIKRIQGCRKLKQNFGLAPYCVCSITHSGLTLCNPMDFSPQAPLSMGFYRQEYGGGLPFPHSRGIPNPGIKPGSPASPALAG